MASGSDEKISAAKIEPLASETKYGVEHDMGNRGAVGHDVDIDESRIEPLGGKGQYQNPAPAADSGVIGRDETIQESKIEPLAGPLSAAPGSKGSDGTYKGDVGDTTGVKTGSTSHGLDDEAVDGARIAPMGEVREELKQ